MALDDRSACSSPEAERDNEIQHVRGFLQSKFRPGNCALDDAGERTLAMAVRPMSLSTRAHDRVLKVAHTIADLAGSERVTRKHLAEAVQYRSLDRSYWS